MSSASQIAANRRNAQLSTGPRTTGGIAVARMNALSHGLRTAAPVVPGEVTEAWEQFRDAVVDDLTPVGALEEELAERVAVLSWRLRRVTSYEAGVVTRNSDRAALRASGELEPDELTRLTHRSDAPPTLKEMGTRVQWARDEVARYEHQSHLFAELATSADDTPLSGADALLLLRDVSDYLPKDEDEDVDDEDVDPVPDPMTNPRTARFLHSIGVPEDQHDEPEEWGGWTAGAARQGIERIARTVKWTRQKLLDRAVKESVGYLSDWRGRLANAERQLEEVKVRTRTEEREARRRALVPVAEVVDVVLRYETHLQKQLALALHELERRQAYRSPCPPQPPVAVDVSVVGADGVPALTEYQ
jgi:hypothetical protein